MKLKNRLNITDKSWKDWLNIRKYEFIFKNVRNGLILKFKKFEN